MPAPFVHLASQSPRRQELLRQIGVDFELVAVAVDEAPLPGESAEAMAARLALAKARAGHTALAGNCRGPVLGSDTVVTLEGEIFGKPAGREAALAMLGHLSGRCHRVVSVVAVVGDAFEEVSINTTSVCFRDITVAEREAYWATGEPADKAGAYAIQGRAAMFVTRIDGSYSGVMGLPVYETAQLLERAGLRLLAAGQSGVQ